MIKVEVIKDFTLERFNEITNLKRGSSKDKDKSLYIKDTFECDKKLCDYLLGNNPKSDTVVKVIEIIPEKAIKTEDITKKAKKSKKNK